MNLEDFTPHVSTRDTGPSVDRNKPKLKPGDNPNKLNAQRRKIRPKVTNSEKSSSPYELQYAWADPAQGAIPDTEISLEPHLEEFPSGEIELDEDLPATIAKPFCDTFKTLGDRTVLDEARLENCQDSLMALSYYKSAKQLFSTMLDPDKSVCQPLKSVFYDTTPIPEHMGAAISMIGNFDSKVGPIHIKNAPTLFKRWVVSGLHYDPGAPEYEGELPPSLVWRDRDGKKLLDSAAYRYIEENRPSWSPTGDYDIQVPLLKPGMDVTRWIQRIHPDTPNCENLRNVASIIRQPEKHWIRGDPLIGCEYTQALDSLGLEIATGIYDVGFIRQAFESAMADYYVAAKPHIEALLKTGPSPASNRGYGAQIVKSNGLTARYNMPLSDSDVALGFLFSPCKNFEYSPKIIAYNKRDQSVSKSKFASADLRQPAI